MTQTRFMVVPASYVLLLRGEGGDTEVLLQQRGDVPYMAGHWAAGAAGHVEHGEDAFAAARREAEEELGITGLELTFLTTMQRTQGADPIDERVDFFLSARAWSGSPAIREPGKATDLRWFRLTDLPDPLVPHEGEVLRHLRQGAVPAYLSLGF